MREAPSASGHEPTSWTGQWARLDSKGLVSSPLDVSRLEFGALHPLSKSSTLATNTWRRQAHGTSRRGGRGDLVAYQRALKSERSDNEENEAPGQAVERWQRRFDGQVRNTVRPSAMNSLAR